MISPDKYARSVTLLCPTCGNTQFEFEGSDHNVNSIRCPSCDRTFTKEELIHENGEVVSASVDEMSREIINDITKDFKAGLKKAFQGSKFIKVR
ncbi:hypothetical protein SAMN03159463_04514 [Mesorhizobium sp. NFR06]|uniref:ECs_2282 family putative zinc-binding protein n=1 Tax=Mesorhizobium sp. NFR06 TaxID=1566290 RepID=UPI0008F2621E|nr:hypothetical protein [Mesorhizobium sp. NFR06]SFP58481.1 hypothetical protein SAMN03159463_04514 [Mesorhizobium sp. NFR06]